MTGTRASLGIVLALAAACGPRASTPAPFTEAGEGARGASSGSAIERFFPIVHGHLWHYDTWSDEGDRGRLLVRARRIDERSGELVTPTGTRRIAFFADGVALPGLGVYVLKAPLAQGNSWKGEHGGWARIEAVGVSVDVPAGQFSGCVVALEEKRGDMPVRYTTTFCPDVGIVALDVDTGAAHERAELRSYGPPVDLGPAGTSFSTEPP